MVIIIIITIIGEEQMKQCFFSVNLFSYTSEKNVEAKQHTTNDTKKIN